MVIMQSVQVYTKNDLWKKKKIKIKDIKCTDDFRT